ncbi:MAG: glycosyltransferase family 61 protein [Rhodospirillaceae bacterium]|nr:glycosyltransferase family 61 protein [Rhodospirillaceae bacterium]
MDKFLNVLDITRAGAEVALEAIGRGSEPLVFARVPGESPLQLRAPFFLNRAEFASAFPAGLARRGEDLICAVQDCFLLGPFGAVVLPAGQLLRQSVINLEGDALQYSLAQFTGQYPGTHIPWSSAEAPVFAANSYATNNYFHFLIDSLANLHWRARVPGATDLKYIVSGYGAAAEATLPFIPSAYAGLNMEAAGRQPFDGTLLFCRSLVFPRRVTGADSLRVAWLRQGFGVAATRGTDKLYIARGDAQRRRIVNERDLMARLEKRGFLCVTPGALPVRDQAQMFAHARLVVGPHGAGLANCAFMAPGGALVELTHTGRVVSTYHELAGAAGLGYGAVIGELLGDPGQPILADFAVDIEAVDAAIAEAEKGI